MRMGLREANQHFSRVIKAVNPRQEVILTDRGEPIAVIRPLQQPVRPDAVLRRLEVAGILRRASNPTPMAAWRPRTLRGAPIAQTLREERETPDGCVLGLP